MQEIDLYFDYAAATPLDERVLAAMQPYFQELFFNPSSPYRPAVQVRSAYEEAKADLARAFGARAGDIIMTAGATESVALAFTGVQQSGGHVVVPEIEHHAVLAAAQRCASASFIAADPQGRISPQAVAAAIRPETELISVGLANSELGTVQPLKEIAEAIEAERVRRREHGERRPLYFHTDASQGAGQIDIHPQRLGVDMMTLNAGKVYGPKQVGLLWAASSVALQPLIAGGGQERGLRSGTENVAGTVGFAKALQLAVAHQRGEFARLSRVKQAFLSTITELLVDEVMILSPRKGCLPSHVSLSIPGIDAERVLFLLEMKQMYVSTGSACAANKGTRSHVLAGIGLDDAAIAGSLRITFGRYSTEETAKRGAQLLAEVVRHEQQRQKSRKWGAQ